MNQFDDAWRKIVTRAWSDPQYKQQLMDNPNKVLAAAGAPVPAGINFVVVENEPSRLHLIIPSQSAVTGAGAANTALSDYHNAICW